MRLNLKIAIFLITFFQFFIKIKNIPVKKSKKEGYLYILTKNLDTVIELTSFKHYYFFLNENALYYSKTKLRNDIMGAFIYFLVLTDFDKQSIMLCCVNVGIVEKRQELINDELSDIFCFKIKKRNFYSIICDYDQDNIENWYSSFVREIKLFGFRDDPYNKVTSIVAINSWDENIKFEYDREGDWEGFCEVHYHQSPININPWKVKKEENFWVHVEFRSADNPKAVFEHQSIYIYGNFGRMLINYYGLEFAFNITKFTFKFPGEHQINNEIFTGELQIFCENRFIDRDFIIAIPLKENLLLDSTGFFESLKTEKWVLGPQEDNCLHSTINLDNLFKDGITNFLTEYYWYKGSFTYPPCIEGVNYLVSKKALELPPLVLDTIAVSSKYSTVKRNSRKIVNNINYPTIYSIQQRANCNEKTNELNNYVNNELKGEIGRNDVGLDRKYFKAILKNIQYRKLNPPDKKTIVGDINENTNIEVVPAEKVPLGYRMDDVKRNLRHLDKNELYSDAYFDNSKIEPKEDYTDSYKSEDLDIGNIFE